MRMQVECPICSTKLVFEVLPQYAGRTVRVTCTNCATDIDASTDLPAAAPHQIGGPSSHFEQESRMQLANGLANRMHGHPQNNMPGFGVIHNRAQQNSNMQADMSQQHIRQQQQQQLKQRAQQHEHAAGKNAAETLKYEVQCPHPEVRMQTCYRK